MLRDDAGVIGRFESGHLEVDLDGVWKPVWVPYKNTTTGHTIYRPLSVNQVGGAETVFS